MSCLKYTIFDTGSPCSLTLVNNGNEIGLSLVGASVWQADGFVHLQTSMGGITIADGCPGLSKDDIQALIDSCNCGSAGPSGDPDDPISIDLSANFVDCTETVTEAIPVRVICSDIEQVQLACSENGELLYLSVAEFPPTAFNFNGTPYTGTVVPCEREVVQHFEDYCNDDGTYTKITCVNKLDPSDVQVTWLFEGSVVGPPVDVRRCEDVCNPHVAQFNGDPTNSEPYNKISVSNPNKCCITTVSTSAGTFTVDAGSVFCLEWECNLDPEINITTDDPECLSSIKTTIQRTK